MQPLATVETRWFFDGDSAQHPTLRRWFETVAPFPRAAGVGEPQWTGRAGGEPDVYLLMPGCTEMGIKWREGTLQIKGRVEDVGVHRFGERHAGRVQRWIKWTCADVPDAWRSLLAAGDQARPETAAVQKTRALRMIGLDGGAPREVSPGVVLDRGIGFEMTDLEVEGKRYCSIGFEAFPDDAAISASFAPVVAGLVAKLDRDLEVEASLAYPDWLCR